MYDSTFAVLTNIFVEQESMKNFNESKILMRRQFMDEVFKICLFYYVLLFYYENDESRENRFSTSEGVVLLAASARRKLAGFYNG